MCVISIIVLSIGFLATRILHGQGIMLVLVLEVPLSEVLVTEMVSLRRVPQLLVTLLRRILGMCTCMS